MKETAKLKKLSEEYCVKSIIKDTSLKEADIPVSLIKLKKSIIQFKRLTREQRCFNLFKRNESWQSKISKI